LGGDFDQAAKVTSFCSSRQ